MFVKMSYEDDFYHLLLDLKEKYPKEIFKLNGIADEDLDVVQFSKQYFMKKNVADSSVDANANVQIKNISTYKTEVHKGLDKLNSIYLLWKQAKRFYGNNVANELVELEINKSLYINDFNNFNLSYCFAFDTADVLNQGLPYIDNFPSDPAKHSDIFMQHILQMLQFMSHQLMGATAIPNFLLIYGELLRQDSLDPTYPVPNYLTDRVLFDRYLQQKIQEFVFLLNQPTRIVQSTFTNITIFDSIFLKEICSKYLVRGQNIDVEFAMFIQKEFLKYHRDILKGKLGTFPVLSVQFKKDEEFNIEDIDFLDYLSEINLDFAHINILSETSLTAISACCRLVSNVEDLLKVSKDESVNQIGGSSIKIGSFGVVTLNLARIGFLAKNEEDYLNMIDNLVSKVFMINHCRRALIQQKIDEGQMTGYKYGLISLKNQYSTLGINGLYESLAYFGLPMETEEGKYFSDRILNRISKLVNEKIKKYEYRCNAEQVPAETVAIKLAQADKILYKKDDYKLYANQFIPLTSEYDILDRIDIQARFEKYFSGGTIAHLNTGHKITSKEVMKNLIMYTVKAGVKYFAVNYFFTKCKNNHIEVGSSDICPNCGEEVLEKYTRIVGFIVPVSSWKKERREEFDARLKYDFKEVKEFN